MALDRVRAEVSKRWSDGPIADVCFKIIDHISKVRTAELSFLTYRSLCQITSREEPDEVLLAALNALSVSSFSIMEQRALFVDGDDELEISSSDLAVALRTGKFVHPESGELVQDFERALVPFFCVKKSVMAEIDAAG